MYKHFSTYTSKFLHIQKATLRNQRARDCWVRNHAGLTDQESKIKCLYKLLDYYILHVVKVLSIGPLPLSVKHTPPHHHYFVLTLSPCSNKRRKSFPMRLAPRSPLTHSYLRHQGGHAKKGVIAIMKYKQQASSVPQSDPL